MAIEEMEVQEQYQSNVDSRYSPRAKILMFALMFI
jgi:hypothetical protein